METVNKYLINEGKTATLINKSVKGYQQKEMKLAQEFAKKIQKLIGSIYDIEGLEDYRDNVIPELPISRELAYDLADAIEVQIEKLWNEPDM